MNKTDYTMTIQSTKYLTPALIITLVIGLAGTLYLYNETKTSLINTQQENAETQLELSQLTESYDQLSAQLQELTDSNTELESRIAELEQANKPDIVLDISATGDVRNVILLIGDGMGPGQLSAAEVMNGEDSLIIMGLPYMSMVTTYSSSNYITDSAASATAIATGYKTNNGAISMTPDGETLRTVVEVAEDKGLSTGVVTNTRVTHATPAAFMAHINSRNNEVAIAQQVIDSGVDVILGGGSTFFTAGDLSSAGYTVVVTTAELLDTESSMVFGLFATGYMSYDDMRDPVKEPSLAQMTRKSIDLLSSDPDGFFTGSLISS